MELTCRDADVSNCSFVVKGNDETELVHNLMEHIKKDHRAVLEKMAPKQRGHIIHRVHHLLHVDTRAKNLW